MKYVITIPTLCLILFTFTCLKAINAVATSYPVSASVAGITVNAAVDSAIARHLIEGRTDQLSTEVRLDLEGRLACQSIYDLPDTDTLGSLARDYTADTATALLIRCLNEVPEIRKSQALFVAELKRWQQDDLQVSQYVSDDSDRFLVLFIPGWGYLSSGEETGSDLRKPREIISSMGIENHLVELEDYGSIESNANYLTAALQKYGRTGKKIILVSASSGGPAVALSLRDPSVGNNPQLVGWLNICGVLHGSPIIDNYLPWPKSLVLRAASIIEGWKYKDLMSLSQVQSKPRHLGFVPPPQLTIVNYIGIPFSGQLSRFGKGFYRTLKDLGPNDGLTLITDALAPGYTVMAVGSDHFVNEDPDIDIKTAALVPVLFKLIEHDRRYRQVNGSKLLELGIAKLKGRN